MVIFINRTGVQQMQTEDKDETRSIQWLLAMTDTEDMKHMKLLQNPPPPS